MPPTMSDTSPAQAQDAVSASAATVVNSLKDDLMHPRKSSAVVMYLISQAPVNPAWLNERRVETLLAIPSTPAFGGALTPRRNRMIPN
jgi:uncharacterized protein (DUF4213/DUF364 family)